LVLDEAARLADRQLRILERPVAMAWAAPPSEAGRHGGFIPVRVFAADIDNGRKLTP
jgi:hypothetical protein